ncbi:MAG: hypothetical protein N2578_02585 [Bdellovibrionaceae bacterium]|nr:hypothetical protein [Pseudobdellovibrionaceae bacterium]
MNLQDLSPEQMENILSNRVPFLLLSLSANFEALFPNPLHRSFARSMAVEVDAENALPLLSERKTPLYQAIVIAGSEKEQRRELAKRLESAGYTNVFVYMH